MAWHDHLDGIVNNVDVVGSLAQRPLDSLNLADFDAVMAINMHGVLARVKHTTRVMVPRCSATSSAWPTSPACSAASPPHLYNVSKSALVSMVSVVAVTVVVSRRLQYTVI
uniref:Uncharacterized protein n=1 Tax=Oryza brachyantha TaxID=4533 RepID=J3KWP6_ORYBR